MRYIQTFVPYLYFLGFLLIIAFGIIIKWPNPWRGFTQLGILVGSELLLLCNKGIPCSNCPLSFGICPVGTTQRLAFIKEFPAYLTVGAILAIGFLLGTLTCGWACPLGFVQDLFSSGPNPKFDIPKKFSRGRYGGLILLVILIYLEFRYQTFSRQGYQVLNELTIYGGALLLSLGLFFKRPFCKVFCPFGLILGKLNRVSPIKVPLDCQVCHRCTSSCLAGLKPAQEVNDDLCVKCHHCRITCPQKIKSR